MLSPDASVYSPKDALADARLACRLNYWKKASYIESLAAASAATGDFDAAIRSEQQAIESGKLSSVELKAAQARLASYSDHQPPRHATR